jgi:hypothetical protein
MLTLATSYRRPPPVRLPGMTYDREPGDYFFDTASWTIRSRTEEVLVENEVRSIDGPHVVECRVVGTGIVSYAGPFANGISALLHAEAESRTLHDDDAFVFTAVALVPPHHLLGSE